MALLSVSQESSRVALLSVVSLLLLLMGFFPGWPMGEKAVALDVEGRWLQIGAKAMVARS